MHMPGAFAGRWKNIRDCFITGKNGKTVCSRKFLRGIRQRAMHFCSGSDKLARDDRRLCGGYRAGDSVNYFFAVEHLLNGSIILSFRTEIFHAKHEKRCEESPEEW